MDGSNGGNDLSPGRRFLNDLIHRQLVLTEAEKQFLLLVIALAMIGLATRLWHIHAAHTGAAGEVAERALSER